MCGYFGNVHESAAINEIVGQLNISLDFEVERAYQRSIYSKLITGSEGSYQASPAMWWYALKHDNGKIVPNEKLTSFNARDLTEPLWREAAQMRRGVVFAQNKYSHSLQ